MTQTSSVCIIGGGISGAALAWSFAKAAAQPGGPTQWNVTVMHDEQDLGGHASSYPVQYQGTTYNIDLGVQMIAPVMYPNTMCMLEQPEFATIKAAMQPVELAIAAGFAPAAPGAPTPYWGNFPAYQTTPLWQSGSADCAAFEQPLESHPYSLMTLATYLADHQNVFTGGSSAHFETYFLDALLSILNGYSSPLTNELLAPEIAFVFDHDLGSFEHPTTGFQRFGGGAASFPQEMGAWAQQHGVTTIPYTLVDQVSPTIGGPATVTYHSTKPGTDPVEQHARFDYVVIAVDQYNAGKMLEDSPLWSSHYSQYVGQEVWKLFSQWSYLHTDRSVLTPGMPMPPQETLQYNEYFGADHGYATYIGANVVGLGPEHFDAFPYMVSMYAFDPATAPPMPGFHVPNPTILEAPPWYHGMWLPSFFWDAKRAFHAAQGISTNSAVPPLSGQADTHVYFAGNNLTMDSAEGAILAAMVTGHYAFGLPVTDMITTGPNLGTGRSIAALLAYFAFYELMFPSLNIGASTIAHQLLAFDGQR